jgi:hypothetical protein
LKINILYHRIFEDAFRIARLRSTEATRRAVAYAMDSLLTYVRTEKLQGNPLYSRSDNLAQSINTETRVSGEDVYGIMGTDIGWIDVHERGAVIYPKTAPYLRFPLYERGTGTFRGYRTASSVTIPRRSVIGSMIREKKDEVRRVIGERFNLELKRQILAETHGKRFNWGAYSGL